MQKVTTLNDIKEQLEEVKSEQREAEQRQRRREELEWKVDDIEDEFDHREENARFHIDSLTSDALATGKTLFRQHEPLSFIDACIVAYMHTEELGYLYAFDDELDTAAGIHRLDTPTNPYEPN